MKKVRYAIGALGAVPALGLMMPTANAATATHAPRDVGKTVSLKHIETPLITCGTTTSKVASANRLHGYILYQGHCIAFQQAHLDFSKTGLTERTRFYNAGGGRIAQTFNGGTITHSPNRTWFSSSPNVTDAYKVCQALVFNGTSTVYAGPVCENT